MKQAQQAWSPEARESAAPPAAPAPPPPAPMRPGREFLPEAKALLRVAACAEGELPPGLDPAVVEAHCAILRPEIEKFRSRWLTPARAFFAGLVPLDVPRTVVYPFGGGDLLTALATFPRATEITTLSLELTGDARAIGRVPPAQLRQLLDGSRQTVLRLFAVSHSKTLNLIPVMRGEMPGLLIFALVALVVHGYEPVSLRYVQIADDGSLRYLTEEDIAAAEAQAKSPAARARIFANMELQVRPRGGQADLLVYRHFAANLDDVHLQREPAVLRHLEAKGRITAMTKAASYLLGFDEFSRIRSYLLSHMEWMISDSTGIPPRWARPAGFAQETYGRYAGPFLAAGLEWAGDLRRLWASQPFRPLAFRYGYPDKASQHHLMVTRRKLAATASAATPPP